MKNIYIKNDSLFYKNVRKYLNRKEIIHFIYEDNDIIDNSKIDEFPLVEEKIHMIHALNIKDISLRYSYIYDIVCNYLDKEFQIKDICNFENSKCISVRNNSHCPNSKNGCCYGTNRGLCKNCIDGRCSIKSLSCNLLTCSYLKKQGIKYSVNDISLLKYFFNIRQKYILDTSIFKDKDEIISLLLKNR